jgi:hypothetical protein
MSALGQKRTYAVQQVMSALPPIATIKADMRDANGHVCFLMLGSSANQQQDYPKRTGIPLRLER